jgi:hypothetical protein
MYQNSTASTLLISCLIIFVSGFCGCASSSLSKQQQRLLAQLDSSQVVMTEFTRRQTDQLLKATAERLADPSSSEKAKKWQLKMMQIKEYTKSITTYLQNLHHQLATANVYQVFVKEIKGKELHHQLFEYKKNILNTDGDIYEEFFRTIGPKTDTADNTAISQDYIRQYLTGLTNAQAGVFLHKLEQQFALNENRLITYCFYQTRPVSFCGFNEISQIINQSSTVVQTGEVLTITAGIGQFSYRIKPVAIINGQTIPITYENPVAAYKLKIKEGVGKYSLPVQLRYLDPNGAMLTWNTKITYTVR